jgi:hypothetical protein
MALTEPLAITIAGTTHSLPRVRTRDMAADYQNADQTVFENVSHLAVPKRKSESGAGVRSLVAVEQRKIVADPLNAESQEFKTLRIQVVIDRPIYGFSSTEVDALWTAFKTQFNTAMMAKVYGQES